MKKGNDGYKNEGGDYLSMSKDCGVSSSPDVLLQELKMSLFSFKQNGSEMGI